MSGSATNAAMILFIISPMYSLLELDWTRNQNGPFRPALTDHLLAVGVERVVDNPLGRIQGVIILEPETPKAFGDRLEPRGLRLVPEGVVRVGAVDDSREMHERW